MKRAASYFLVFGLFLLLSTNVSARSGCCSHHDGVRADGCGCNDGTPLSSTCAPYYSCAAVALPTQIPPTETPTPKPTRVVRPTATPKPKVKKAKKAKTKVTKQIKPTKKLLKK